MTMSSTLTTIWHSHCLHNIIIIIMLTVICRQNILTPKGGPDIGD